MENTLLSERVLGIQEQAPARQNQGLRQLKGAFAVMGASVLALLGAESMVVSPDEAYGDQTLQQLGAPYCHYPDNYNTILCSRTKLQAEEYCARAVTIQPPENFRGRYTDKSRGKYSLSFSDPVIGCSPAGVREDASYTELRQGPQGNFTRNSEIVSFKTNKAFNTREALQSPINCSAAGMVGSAIRPVVKVTWLTAKGWPHLPKSTATHTFEGKTQTVC